jgi:hypothetical protein
MKLLRANWKTTVSGIGAAICSLLTIVAALPYEAGGVADVFPVSLKPKIMMASAAAALLLKIANSLAQKDKDVTGGSVQQTLGGNLADRGTQTLVDQTVRGTIQSGETVTPEQKRAVS